MINVQWRRVRLIARTILEECAVLEKPVELSSELDRILLLTDSVDEIADIPRIYTEAPEAEFLEMAQEIRSHYQEMLSHARRLTKESAK